MAQETREPGVRRIPAGRYPYLVYYTVEANEVVILHVRHGARRSPWEEDD
jgi:plasmid stabilization system protein ParE